MFAEEEQRRNEYDDFYRLQEIAARDKEFLSSHTKDWYHGSPMPYRLVSYTPLELFAARRKHSGKLEVYFQPKITLDRVEAGVLTRLSLRDGADSEPTAKSPYEADFKRDWDASVFLSFLQLPSFSYLRPQMNLSMRADGHFCYQTHFDIEDLILMFGGMTIDPNCALRRLQIPRATDPLRILVHFACDLPPHLNKDVLLLPFLTNNLDLVLFNPMRGTAQGNLIDNSGVPNPGKVCGMQGTRVTQTQVFFCGGFIVEVDNVVYDKEINRWLVYKLVRMNEDGFLFDLRTKLFLRVVLRYLRSPFHGMMGNGIASNVFRHLPSADSPFQFSEGDLSEQARAERSDQESRASRDSKETGDTKYTKETKETKESKESKESEPRRSFNAKDRELKEFREARAAARERETPERTPTPPTRKALPGRRSFPPTHLNNSIKMPLVLMKLAKIFHRHNKGHIFSHSLGSSQLVLDASSRQLPDLCCRHNTVPPAELLSPVRSLAKLPIHRRSTDSLESSLLSERALIDQQLARGRSLSLLPSEEEIKDTALESGVYSVTVYLFGGFELRKNNDRIGFESTNRMLRIDLVIDDGKRFEFHPEALVFDVLNKKDPNWPSKRGYFSYALVCNDLTSEFCTMEVGGDEEPESQLDPSASKFSVYFQEVRLEQKSLLVQGGVDENGHVCSDIYLFNFATFSWHRFQTYAYDYFQSSKKPYEDENMDDLQLENALDDPPLVEAELRSCHNHAALYRQDNREYVVFIGGFSNDYLRHFDAEPYESDRFDVLRLSRFSLSSTNPTLLRVSALNLKTQTWSFMRFFFDFTQGMSSEAMNTLMGNTFVRNLRISFYGGACTMAGKQITICHGIIEFVPEKKEHFNKFKEQTQSPVIMSGAHFFLTFPSL